MKKKTVLLILCVFLVALISVAVLSACNGNSQQGGEGEEENKSEAHVHSDACWQKGTSVRGNCVTYGYSEYQCLVTGEIRREYETKYGNHEYLGHVCRLCGARESSETMWSSGATTIYLYNVYVDISDEGRDTYWLVVTGEGATASYTNPTSLPWSEYISKIVRFEVTDGVTELGAGFMANATALTDITFGSTLRVIGARCFENCSSIETIRAQDSALTTVKEYAFASCSSMTECALPKSCTKIEKCAFNRCTSLRSLTIPKVGADGNGAENRFFGSIFSENVGQAENATQSLTYEGVDYGFVIPSKLAELTLTGDFDVEAYAMRGTNTLRSVTFAGGTTEIKEYGLAYMELLADLVFTQNTLTTIGNYAFRNDVKLGSKKYSYDENGVETITERVIALPNSLTSIGEGAFMSCSGMEHIELASTRLTEIPQEAFSGCAALVTVTLPETLTVMFRKAFELAAFSEIRIPASVRTLGAGVFNACAKLATVYVDSEFVYYLSKTDTSNLFDAAQTVYVLDEAVTDDPKEESESYIKKNFRYRGIGEDTNGYHLWTK